MAGEPYPTDRSERCERIQAIKEDQGIAWQQRIRRLTDEYYDCDEALSEPAAKAMVAAYRRAGVPLPPLPF